MPPASGLDVSMGFPETHDKMPVIFVGHGSPINALEENEFSRSWAKLGESFPEPRAILCVSAHWETEGCAVTAMEHPKTIHDFYGFPQELYNKLYPAPGSPMLAGLVRETIHPENVRFDYAWGLDHGAWSVLCHMFPRAEIPVIQLSLDTTKDSAAHYRLGQKLKPLRKRGVLVLGSGNIVHNLGNVVWEDRAYDWAVKFDAEIKRLILSGDHEAIIDYRKLDNAHLAAPTSEHFLPLLYTLAMQDDEDEIGFFTDRVTMGSMSMRSVRIG